MKNVNDGDGDDDGDDDNADGSDDDDKDDDDGQLGPTSPGWRGQAKYNGWQLPTLLSREEKSKAQQRREKNIKEEKRIEEQSTAKKSKAD